MTNRYFVIEGPDGCGKTTQLRLLKAALQAELSDCIIRQTREPGGPPASEAIREILKNPAFAGMKPLTNLLLFNAARCQTIEEQIKPALERGDIILTDRSFLSTIAYQGFAQGLDKNLVKQVCDLAMDNVYPSLIVLLEVSFKEARRRMKAEKDRLQDGFDGRSASFHHKVRQGYNWAAQQYSSIIHQVNGERDEQVIAAEILDLVMSHWDS